VALDPFPWTGTQRVLDPAAQNTFTSTGSMRLIDGETPDAIIALLTEIGLYTPPTPVRFWTGAVTSTTVGVNFDVVATDASTIDTVGAAIGTSSAMTTIVAQSANTPPALTAGLVRLYYTGAFTLTGLTADTVYYAAPVVNGIVRTDVVARFRTAPVVGTAKRFNFVAASCTNPAYILGDPYAPVAALAPAFVVHMGDMAYSDIVTADAGAQRDTNTRQWRGTSGVQAMLLAAPIVYCPDDHDMASDDNQWDKIVSTGVANSVICANTRLVVRETTPLYPQWNTNVLSQSWTWGRVRFIMPDLRSQRRYVDGGPTFLGDGSDPPTGYDQKAAVFAAIDQAATDGMKILVFLSTSTWAPAIFDSWDRYNSAEQSELADKFRNSPVHVMLIHGDAHQGVVDDGTNTDRSSGQDGKLPLFCTSGWNWGAPFHQITDVSWDGADGDVTGENGNGTLFINVSIEDDGGDDIHWEVEFFGGPLSGNTATSLGVYRDDDVGVEVGFSSASALPLVDGEDAQIAVSKTWFGPITGCTIDYAWASGPSGTATFNPNCNTALIPRVYTDGTGDTVTISNPVRCTLGANTAKTISYFTPEAETLAWLAEVDEAPSSEVYSALNTFIAGLKADGLWTQILKLYWLGAYTRQASLVEMKSPGIGTLTVVGAPGFTGLLGWRGTNTNGSSVPHLETGYAIPSGNQNSIAAFVRCVDAQASFSGEFGGERYYINPWSTTNAGPRMRSSSTTSNTAILGSNTPGSFGFSRTGSANYKMFKDGASIGTITQASTAPGATTMWFCGFQDATNPTIMQSGSRRLAVGMISAGLSDADALAYYNRETTFLQTLGTIA
jgi:hypothetical protein